MEAQAYNPEPSLVFECFGDENYIFVVTAKLR